MNEYIKMYFVKLQALENSSGCFRHLPRLRDVPRERPIVERNDERVYRRLIDRPTDRLRDRPLVDCSAMNVGPVNELQSAEDSSVFRPS